jgi:hypothetical protein
MSNGIQKLVVKNKKCDRSSVALFSESMWVIEQAR